MTLDNDSNHDNGNIINMALWKPAKKAAVLSSTWVATDPLEEVGMSEGEMRDTWSLTEEEFGDLTYWGIEFRKSVLLQHSSALRNLAERQDRNMAEALGDQLALAVGALLIARTSVKEVGELVEAVKKGDAVIAGQFDELSAVHLKALGRSHLRPS